MRPVKELIVNLNREFAFENQFQGRQKNIYEKQDENKQKNRNTLLKNVLNIKLKKYCLLQHEVVVKLKQED